MSSLGVNSILIRKLGSSSSFGGLLNSIFLRSNTRHPANCINCWKDGVWTIEIFMFKNNLKVQFLSQSLMAVRY